MEIRKTYKTGGSVVITLPDGEEDEYYRIIKTENGYELTKIEEKDE